MEDRMDVDEPMLIEEWQERNEQDEQEGEETRVYFAEQISWSDYHRQADDLTQQELRKLRNSAEFQRWHQTCRSCKKSWNAGEFSLSCVECGGHAMQRDCPVCSGSCGAVFQRDVEMSHKFSSAHWNGVCRLPREHQAALFLLKHSDISTEDVLSSVSDLTTN